MTRSPLPAVGGSVGSVPVGAATGEGGRTYRRVASPRWFLRFTVAAFAVATVVVAPATAASAHVNVVGSTPADGAVVGQAPTAIVIRFSEDVDPKLAELTLSAKGGSPVALQRGRSAGRELTVDLPALDKGVYSVSYKVRDPLDLHLTAGSIVFGVGTSEALVPAGAKIGSPRPFELVARTLERVALAMVVGAVAIAVFVAPRGGSGRRRLVDRALWFVRAGALGLLIAAPVQIAVEAIDIGPPWLTTIKTVVAVSSYGRRVLVLAVLAAGAWALAGIVRRALTDATVERWHARRYDELSLGLVVLAVGACVAVSVGGHAATGGSFVAGVALRVVHLTAMGTWAGGLAVLTLALRGVAVGVDVDRAAVWRAFGALAAPAFAALVVTGLLLTGRGLATVTALLTTWYGLLLLGKLVVLAAASVFGLRHASQVRGAGVRRARGLGTEAVLAALVVVGGAALTASPPGLGLRFSKAPAPTPPPVAQQLGDVTVKLSMRPNRPGPNLVTATVVSVRRPEPGPISEVTLTLTPSVGDAVTVRGGVPKDGKVEFGTVDLPQAGALEADVTVDRQVLPIAPARFAWYVDPVPVPRAATVVSDARLAPVTSALAALVVLGSLALLALDRRRRAHAPLPASDAHA